MSWLAEGPRGRRLCWELLRERDLRLPWLDGAWSESEVDPEQAALRFAAELQAALDLVDLDALAVTEAELTQACGQSVGWARYWQAPDEVDFWLAQPALREAMAAVSTVIAALIPAWWHSGMDAGAQVQTDLWPDRPDKRGAPRTTGRALVQWRLDMLREEEEAKSRPTDLDANTGGRWTSTPWAPGMPSSTRALADGQAVELLWREDSLGQEKVTCRSVAGPAGARIYEIDSPETLVHLVERYPLEVTRSRRHDWWRATGATGPLLITDFAAARLDYQGIHLTVAGYLRTAGRALPTAGGATTVLAGWDPDKTWWLTDLEVTSAEAPWSFARPYGWAQTGVGQGRR